MHAWLASALAVFQQGIRAGWWGISCPHHCSSSLFQLILNLSVAALSLSVGPPVKGRKRAPAAWPGDCPGLLC